MRYSQEDGVNTSLSRILYPRVGCTCRLLLCVWESTVARSCAAWDDNNKDNVCTPTIPAGLKCPLPSKTTSLITRFGLNSTRLAGRILEDLPEVFGHQARDPVSQGPCEKVFFYIGWKSKAEELILPPRSEENREYHLGAKRHR